MNTFDWGPLLQGGPLFLGILNLTPDSFSDGGRYTHAEAALAQARVLVAQGCRMLDVGAESTRPGAQPTSPDEEWTRLEATLHLLRQALPEVPLSLDTRYPTTGRKGLEVGVQVLNDVTGLGHPDMVRLVQESGCGAIAMRSRIHDGALVMPPYLEPGETSSQWALGELRGLKGHVAAAGLGPDRVLLDPGFGFGTTFPEDLALWNALEALPRDLDWPVDRFCLGISRKRFLAHRAGQPGLAPTHRDTLTGEAHGVAKGWGYRIFRTHALG